jgi:hypothetical protein
MAHSFLKPTGLSFIAAQRKSQPLIFSVVESISDQRQEIRAPGRRITAA